MSKKPLPEMSGEALTSRCLSYDEMSSMVDDQEPPSEVAIQYKKMQPEKYQEMLEIYGQNQLNELLGAMTSPQQSED